MKIEDARKRKDEMVDRHNTILSPLQEDLSIAHRHHDTDEVFALRREIAREHRRYREETSEIIKEYMSGGAHFVLLQHAGEVQGIKFDDPQYRKRERSARKARKSRGQKRK